MQWSAHRLSSKQGFAHFLVVHQSQVTTVISKYTLNQFFFRLLLSLLLGGFASDHAACYYFIIKCALTESIISISIHFTASIHNNVQIKCRCLKFIV